MNNAKKIHKCYLFELRCSIVGPAALYGPECWSSVKDNERRLAVIETKKFRWTRGPPCLDHIGKKDIRKKTHSRKLLWTSKSMGNNQEAGRSKGGLISYMVIWQSLNSIQIRNNTGKMAQPTTKVEEKEEEFWKPLWILFYKGPPTTNIYTIHFSSDSNNVCRK